MRCMMKANPSAAAYAYERATDEQTVSLTTVTFCAIVVRSTRSLGPECWTDERKVRGDVKGQPSSLDSAEVEFDDRRTAHAGLVRARGR
jgi:hypothetical protein